MDPLRTNALTDGPVLFTRGHLVVVEGAAKGTELPLDRMVTRIGSDPSCELVLGDAGVRPVHLELVRDGRGYLVRDLSGGSVQIEGAEVREGYLPAGAVLRLGKAELRFQPWAEPLSLPPSTADRLGGLVGRSRPMRQIFALLERVAPTDLTVLVEGETGTGKDVVARTLHGLSKRASRPFVVVDCGAVAPSLVASELFGHVRGSFTGAHADRAGAFEAAGGGTVFLDEVGELPLDLQPNLLRVLEQREIRRVGADRPVPVDVRVVAATNRNLRRAVELGTFREDLYYRLAVVPVALPPLRARREDLPLLAGAFRAEHGLPPLDEASVARLVDHDWPGNIRELRNVLERAAALEEQLRVPRAGRGPSGFDPASSFREAKERWLAAREKAYLERLLARCEGNVSRAAREAGMDRTYLHRLLGRHGLAT